MSQPAPNTQPRTLLIVLSLLLGWSLINIGVTIYDFMSVISKQRQMMQLPTQLVYALYPVPLVLGLGLAYLIKERRVLYPHPGYGCWVIICAAYFFLHLMLYLITRFL